MRSPRTDNLTRSGRPGPRLARAPNGSWLGTHPPRGRSIQSNDARVPRRPFEPPDRAFSGGSDDAVRAWDDPPPDAAGEDLPALDPQTVAEVEAAGIDLDPDARRAHDVRPTLDDRAHRDADPHTHPHVRSAAGDPPVIGIVGAGAVGPTPGGAPTPARLPVAPVASRGATVAVEGDEQLLDLLARMAAILGATAVRLAPGTKAAYHAGAVLAAGGFVALLDAIARLAAVAGLDEAGALAVYGRLIEQTLGNARAIGIAGALTGPMTRGDVGTYRAHLAQLDARAPGVRDLYVAAARRELALAEERGSLTPEAAAALRDLLAKRA